MIGVLALAVVAIVVAALTGAVRRLALRHELIDVPNQRSSHETPTPRGGGLAIVAGTALAWVAAALSGAAPAAALIVLLLPGLAVAGIGFVDDRAHVAARWRILVHLLAAGVVTAWTGGLGQLVLPGHVIELGWGGAILAMLGIIWMTNLFNFMDGIDGIAGVESATVATHAQGSLDIWAWLVLLGVFVVDATFTLVRRVMRGERFYEAHRSHAYQHAARRLGSHKAVTIAVAAINILWLLPIALLIAAGRIAGIYGFLVAYVPLLWLAVANRAGCNDD